MLCISKQAGFFAKGREPLLPSSEGRKIYSFNELLLQIFAYSRALGRILRFIVL